MRHIYLCECILKILPHELIEATHGYDQDISNVDLHLSGLWK